MPSSLFQMEQNLILHSTAPNPFKPPCSTAPPPALFFTLVLRLATFAILLAIALWANFEASKYFDIKVVNTAKDTLAGRQFDLMFVSNGRAESLILKSCDSIENILYPGKLYRRKPVHKVTLYLASQNLQDIVTVSTSSEGSGEFVISMSLSVMAANNLEMSVAAAVHLGMAHVLLWDGKGKTPRPLLNAMVQCVAILAGLELPLQRNTFHDARNASCAWADYNYVGISSFLQYCEKKRYGFIARLNQAMKEGWNESMVDAALGSPSQHLCSAYLSMTGLEEDLSNFSVTSVSEFHRPQ